MITGLAGRVAIVTGAASGIGAATARLLLDEGCFVVAADLTPIEAAVAAEDSQRWIVLTTDMSTSAGAEAPVLLAEQRFGRLDIVVNCAGIYETSSLEEVDELLWDRVHDVNLRGAYLLSRAAIPVMAKGGHGRIIMFSSVAAQTGGGVAAGPAYVSSKAGVLGLTRSLAQKAGPLGITVNCISPGVIATPMTSILGDEALAATVSRTPVRRLGTAADVAAVVVMLASDAAGFIVGADVDVNGGLHMG